VPVGATVGAAALGAAGSIAGGFLQKSATDNATATQKQMYEEGRSDLAPFRTAGATATNMLLDKLPDLTAPVEMDQATLEKTPGYQFNLRQGLKSVQNGAAARGLGRSGAAAKGAAGFATGLADSTFQQQFANAVTNKQNAFNFLMQPAQLGSNAATASAANANTAGANIGQNIVSGGTALAAGVTGAGNVASNAGNTIGGYNYANQLLRQGYVPAGMYKAA